MARSLLSFAWCQEQWTSSQKLQLLLLTSHSPKFHVKKHVTEHLALHCFCFVLFLCLFFLSSLCVQTLHEHFCISDNPRLSLQRRFAINCPLSWCVSTKERERNSHPNGFTSLSWEWCPCQGIKDMKTCHLSELCLNRTTVLENSRHQIPSK